MALKLIALFCFAAFEIGFIETFRADYTYIESTNSYYKYHVISTKYWIDAKSKCESEGAVLFHPESEAELEAVKSALPSVYVIFSGISDLGGKPGDYRTLDGRAVSQVFHNWYTGEPHIDSNNKYQCGVIVGNVLLVQLCEYSQKYVCKYGPVMMTAVHDVKTIIANASSEITTLVANQTSTLEIFKQEVANQTKAFEDDLMAVKLNVAQLPLLLERIVAVIANQSLTLERIAEADKNQSAALDRQALALEKFVSYIEDPNI